MSNLLPVPAAAIHPGPPAPAVAADPVALSAVAGQLQQRAVAIRSGTPALRSAWLHAGEALVTQRTGAVLAGAWPGSGAALEACATAVEALAQTLRAGAESYASAEAAAVPAALTVEREGAWIP
jgi:uncharacterized protein YukE